MAMRTSITSLITLSVGLSWILLCFSGKVTPTALYSSPGSHSKLSAIAQTLLGNVRWDEFQTASPQNAESARAQELKRMAREIISQGEPVFLEVPQLIINAQNKVVLYNSGVFRKEYLHFDGSDPYVLPFEKQLQIEALRDCFIKASLDEALWKPHLQGAEELVAQTLQEIEADPSAIGLPTRLLERRKQIDRELEKLKTAIGKLAQSKGYAFSSRDGRGVKPVKGFEIEIITDPENGKVKLMPLLTYKKYLLLKINKDRWEWQTLLQKRANLVGGYHYLVTWPDERQDEGNANITNDSPLRFSPAGKFNPQKN